MTHWPNNDVWEERDYHNRSPRPALTECEPLRPRHCARRMRAVVSFVFWSAVFLVCMVGLFYFAK